MKFFRLFFSKGAIDRVGCLFSRKDVPQCRFCASIASGDLERSTQAAVDIPSHDRRGQGTWHVPHECRIELIVGGTQIPLRIVKAEISRSKDPTQRTTADKEGGNSTRLGW